ncbi:MAG: cadmium-translocating P-type ATPase [Ardenticatenaceae bacterium]|nr:cadmium-translocating P-type ATPase [Ardenticatenaceae bacterium]
MRLEKQGGRACESCALALERRLHQVPGVQRASASYVGGVLRVSYDDAVINQRDVARVVEGMGVSVKPSASEATADAEPAPSWLDARLIEAIFTAITLVTMIAGLIIERQSGFTTAAIVLYAIAYVTGGVFGLQGGLESLRQRTIDVDLLMILAAVGAALVGAPFEGAMLLFLFSLSNVLQDYAMDRTRNAIRALMELRPSQALVRRGNKEVVLPIEKILVNDRIIVKPGERIALDGVVLAGESSVDQSSITGESVPVAKAVGSTVFAGTINKNGSLEIGVTKLAKDSTIARLIKMVEEAHSEKAETQRFIDTAEQYYAMGVIVFTALVILVPLLFMGQNFAEAFYRGMTVLVAASPCAIVISTPATVLSAIGNGARRGVLFKGGVYVENAASVKVIAFDKTGTLTVGKPQVTDVLVLDETLHEDELLALTAAAESRSEHALAQATVAAASERNLSLSDALAFQAVTGKGVQAQVDGRSVRIGNLRYFEEMETVGLATAVPHITRLQNEGKTSVLVAQMVEETAQILGIIAFADVVRQDAAQVVRDLRAVGIEKVVMLTGDNRQVAERIAAQVGVDEVYADLLPEDKVQAIKTIEAKYGPAVMVGDGVNDAPALATATIGMAMGAAGTDVALETADIVLMADDLKNIPYVIGLSHKTRQTLVVNLGFALFMILLMLATIFVSGLALPAAVVGHEGGTVLVSLNGLRLLGYKYKPVNL